MTRRAVPGAAAALLLLLLCVGTANAQRPRPTFFVSVELLRGEEVQKELGLDERQLNEIQELRAEVARERQKGLNAAYNLSGNERSERAREVRASNGAQIREGLERILLPEQLERLDQLVRRSEMRRLPSRELLRGRLGRTLGITEEQKKELRSKVLELAEKRRRAMWQLNKESEEGLLEVLTPEQREKFRGLVGEYFQFSVEPAEGEPSSMEDGGSP